LLGDVTIPEHTNAHRLHGGDEKSAAIIEVLRLLN
jgi:hypothetical protein